MKMNTEEWVMGKTTVRISEKVIRNYSINYPPKTSIIHISQGIAIHI